MMFKYSTALIVGFSVAFVVASEQEKTIIELDVRDIGRALGYKQKASTLFRIKNRQQDIGQGLYTLVEARHYFTHPKNITRVLSNDEVILACKRDLVFRRHSIISKDLVIKRRYARDPDPCAGESRVRVGLSGEISVENARAYRHVDFTWERTRISINFTLARRKLVAGAAIAKEVLFPLLERIDNGFERALDAGFAGIRHALVAGIAGIVWAEILVKANLIDI